MNPLPGTYVGGRWLESDETGSRITVIDPSTEQVVREVWASTPDQVDLAVEQAHKALPAMNRLTVEERLTLLDRLASGIEERRRELAIAISDSMGMPRGRSEAVQVDIARGIVVATRDALAGLAFTSQDGDSILRHEPIGVVAAITPWNFPLSQAMNKVAPALAAGCAVVLKASEVTPLDALILAEIIDGIGLPAGAFNLVTGAADVGERLVGHHLVDMVSLTGSTRAGKRVAALAAGSVKRVSLELGGKSPMLVLPEADVTAAASAAVASVMGNSGQTCTALTRLLVFEPMLEEAKRAVASAMAGYKVGPAQDPTADLGPVANAGQRRTVEEFLACAADGETTTVFQYPRESLPGQGYFVPPSAFHIEDQTHRLVQEEIFGPVLVISSYRTLEEAVEMANGTVYGLAAGIWGDDPEAVLDAARRVRAGVVHINGAPWNSQAPFGGWKQSGYGREGGVHGILEFTEFKAIEYRGPAAG
ncbi:aldehyde dehydrogenase family protein [Microtetraspora malaysiensis]|uniref:aldehyde dehydrogenase family protein n=1 Tax=Microtetraspora malaysiensis TaxID=161358 RepID=UPI0008374F52|nr:aldehyde dehydrogenase family protein [Microtetraspora malaysiensis]